MKRASIALGLALASLCLLFSHAQGQSKKNPVSPSAPTTFSQVNVSGTWEAFQVGFYGKMRQTGDRVVGETTVGDPGFIRGGWSQGYLAFVVFRFTEWDTKCNRDSFVARPKQGSVKELEGKWTVDGRPDGIVRTSAESAGDVDYPYEKELKLCGDLPSYELGFDVNSDALKGTNWPILSAVAGLLKNDPGMKIRVVGHTDSTGDPAKNKTLSEKRAEAVKKKLVEAYGADPQRIATEGLGADQPIDDNGTDLGRAINRRVEIAISR